ncbi:MAG: tyrosine-type recombinase/integrase [Planctomycetota bacterium]|jgi:integrase
MSLDRTKYLDANEVKQLRTVTEGRALLDLRAGRVNGPLTWMLIDLALSTGLRVSEMAALAVEDVDLKRGCMRVIRLKRRKAVRETLAIGKDLVDHLKAYLSWRSARVSDLGKSLRKGLAATKGPLFVGCRGPLSAQGLQRVWKSAIKRAGLPIELSIHSARHTIAVALLKKTGNLRQVQKQLGHSSPATTANMYADVPFEDMQSGVTGLYAG